MLNCVANRDHVGAARGAVRCDENEGVMRSRRRQRVFNGGKAFFVANRFRPWRLWRSDVARTKLHCVEERLKLALRRCEVFAVVVGQLADCAV